MTDALVLTTRLDRTQIPLSGAEIRLLIQVGAPSRPGHGRAPLNLAAVVDRSGSMHGPKLDYTRQALASLVDHVDQADLLSVVVYDDQVDTLVPAQALRNKDALKRRLLAIRSGGPAGAVRTAAPAPVRCGPAQAPAPPGPDGAPEQLAVVPGSKYVER